MLLKRPMIIIAGLFLFLVDQFLKRQVLGAWSQSHLVLNNFLGWEQFKNSGIAFGIPVPLNVAIFFTALILCILIYYFITSARAGKLTVAFGFWMIIVGALSNLVDRIVYDATIDYFRIFTGVFNLADGCIIVGVIILLVWQQKQEGQGKAFSNLPEN